MKHILTLLAATLLASPAGLYAADAPRKPNFLFIYTDDQRWDAMSVVQKEQGEKARFPWLKTPNMDRLAGEGVRFRNAFVVNSLCAPSRASFLTGCYGHVNGVRNNQTPFPVDNVTHASLLRQAGYVTGYVGKWHMDRQSGQRPGFDYSASFIGQGQYFDCPFEINGQATPTKGWVDDVSTEYAEQFIRQQGTSPSCSCSATRPATAPSRRRRDTRTPTATPRPAPCRTSRPRPSIVRTAAKERRKASAQDSRQPCRARCSGGVPTNLGMFRGITAVDDNIGKLLKLLDELGLADDTLVVFCQRQRLLPRRTRPGRQTLRLRGEPAHPAAGPLPAPASQGQTRGSDGAEHRPRADAARLCRRGRAEADARPELAAAARRPGGG